MSEPIKVGDLVMVVHTCCSAFVELSPVFVVASIYTGAVRFAAYCRHCHKPIPSELMACDGVGRDRPAYPISWVKRIDPPAIPETVETDEGVTT